MKLVFLAIITAVFGGVEAAESDDIIADVTKDLAEAEDLLAAVMVVSPPNRMSLEEGPKDGFKQHCIKRNGLVNIAGSEVPGWSACCPATCGSCGGSGCERRPGGSAHCCPTFFSALDRVAEVSRCDATPSLRSHVSKALLPCVTAEPDVVKPPPESQWIPQPRKCTHEYDQQTFYDCNNPRCNLHQSCAAFSDEEALENCYCPPHINRVLRAAIVDTNMFPNNIRPLEAGHHIYANTAPACSVPRPHFNPQFLCAMGYGWNVGVSLQALWSMLGSNPLEGGCTVHNTLVVDMSPEQHMKRFLHDGERDMKILDLAHKFPAAGKHYLEYFQQKSPWDCIDVHIPRAGAPVPFTMFQNIVQSFVREGRYRFHFWQVRTHQLLFSLSYCLLYTPSFLHLRFRPLLHCSTWTPRFFLTHRRATARRLIRTKSSRSTRRTILILIR